MSPAPKLPHKIFAVAVKPHRLIKRPSDLPIRDGEPWGGHGDGARRRPSIPEVASFSLVSLEWRWKKWQLPRGEVEHWHGHWRMIIVRIDNKPCSRPCSSVYQYLSSSESMANHHWFHRWKSWNAMRMITFALIIWPSWRLKSVAGGSTFLVTKVDRTEWLVVPKWLLVLVVVISSGL